MNWSLQQHKRYAEQQLKRAEQKRLAQVLKESNENREVRNQAIQIIGEYDD